jgi:AraC-like DNA-binding protein
MRPTPRPLFLLHQDPVLRERLSRAAGSRFRLQEVRGWEELREGVSSAPPAAVILVDPYFNVSNGDGPSPELHALLMAFPSSTVIAAMDTAPARYRDIWLMGEWGIAEILQADEDRSRLALTRRLLQARAQPLRQLLAHEAGVPFTGRARSLMDAAIETVMSGGHPRDLARSLGFSPSTLLRWCERSQLPTPRRLLLWLRVLLASSLLDDPGHSVFSVGTACGYSGDQALRRAIRSVLPHTPTQLRELGAFDTASRAFFRELAQSQDDSAEKR